MAIDSQKNPDETPDLPSHTDEASATPMAAQLAAALTRLGTQSEQLTALSMENRLLLLQITDLKQQLWGKSSERFVPHRDQTVIDLPTPATPAVTVVDASVGEARSDTAEAMRVDACPATRVTRAKTARRATGWRKSIDRAALERVVVLVDDPAVHERRCPLTGEPMQVAFTQEREVLARRPAQFYVKVLRRNVFASPAKSTLVRAPWPGCALMHSEMDASVVAHIAVARFLDHLPYHRLAQQFDRYGIALPRSSQVALMEALARFLQPIVDEIRRHVLASRYMQLDATPVAVMDRTRPGKVREATLWVYRTHDHQHTRPTALVWFDFASSKSPQHPDRVLQAANYTGVLQTDGATGLGEIGIVAQITHVGCLAHARRYFFKAYELSKRTDRRARDYLTLMNRLFRIERGATHFALSPAQRQQLRARYSLPIFATLRAYATADLLANTTPKKSALGKAIHYLVSQNAPLERCLTTLGSRIDNNLVENAIRPVKLGENNWMFCGSMAAGPRMAALYTVLQNCRLADVHPEEYLIDLIARLQSHKSNRLGELLPHAWKASRPASPSTQTSPATAIDAGLAAVT